MKTKLTKLIIIASLFLTACKPQYHVEPYIGEYLGIMSDGYCNNHCDYPKTPDEFVAHYYEIMDLWKDDSICDTIQTVLSFLEQEKKNVKWLYSHPTLETANVGAIYKGDTLFYKTWISEFSYVFLHHALLRYIKYHMEYPVSLEDFLYFDSIFYCKPQEDFIYTHQVWLATREYLWDNKDKIDWVADDDIFVVKIDQDTIFGLIGDASDSRCSYVDKIRDLTAFSDFQGKYDYREETRCAFMTNLKSFYVDFMNKNHCEGSKLYVIEYRSEVGLKHVCENDDFPLDTEWFKELEKHVSQFAQEHGFERILFYTPAY